VAILTIPASSLAILTSFLWFVFLDEFTYSHQLGPSHWKAMQAWMFVGIDDRIYQLLLGGNVGMLTDEPRITLVPYGNST
jgi:hypothetical protein